jgi:hypothetical protein
MRHLGERHFGDDRVEDVANTTERAVDTTVLGRKASTARRASVQRSYRSR